MSGGRPDIEMINFRCCTSTEILDEHTFKKKSLKIIELQNVTNFFFLKIKNKLCKQ